MGTIQMQLKEPLFHSTLDPIIHHPQALLSASIWGFCQEFWALSLLPFSDCINVYVCIVMQFSQKG